MWKNTVMNNMDRHKQQGVAIILILLIVAIATSLAAYIATQQSLWQRQVESQFERGQTRQLGTAGITFARAALYSHYIELTQSGKPTVDHQKSLWTLKLPPIPAETGEVVGYIEDRQGRFNLNNVMVYFAEFEALLTALGLPLELAPALVDWIDPGSVVTANGGAEDEYYLALSKPFRTANKPLVELGELVNIKGFDQRVIEILTKHVSVLPVTSNTPDAKKINVNFATPEVLVAMTGMDKNVAQKLAEDARSNYFTDVADFEKRWKLASGKATPTRVMPADLFTVQTFYYLITGAANVGQAIVKTQVLVERSNSPNAWPTVKWQSVQ
jgi:general secretion pathway protein K